MSNRPYVSIVLATHNRRDVVLNTIGELGNCGLDRRDYEVIVVDNASRDGTCEALRDLRGVRVRQLTRNRGACAKAIGVDMARAPVVLFLDDDSYPRPHCVDRMLLRFEIDPGLGAAGFTAHLPDGSQECSALPHIFVGCGVGFRTAALRQVGGMDLSFFMAAEEYDLSFRLLQAGWNVEIFDDLQVEHLKSPTARRSRRVTFYDICNNLRIIARYLPEPWAQIYREDWIQRYEWFAQRNGHETAHQRGLKMGVRRAKADRRAYRRRRLSSDVLEQVFRWNEIEQRMNRLAKSGVRRIILADLGKNIYAFVRGARTAGIEVLAITDDGLADGRRTYRDIPIIATNDADTRDADAFVVGNTSYVHAKRRQIALGKRASTPVHNWFEPPRQTALPEPIPAKLAELATEPALV